MSDHGTNFSGDLRASVARPYVRALLIYAPAAYLTIDVANNVLPVLHFPERWNQFVIVAVAVLFPVVVGTAWVLENESHLLRRGTRVPKRRTRVAIALPAMAILSTLIFLGVRSHLAFADTANPRTVDPTRVAVLPFEDLSPNQDHAYLAMGLTEEIIHRLGSSPGVKVAPPSAVVGLTGNDKPEAGAIGTTLGAGSVVEGSLQRWEDRLRINVRLVGVADGAQQWSTRFDGPFEDVFAIQDSISRSVARAVGVEIEVRGGSKAIAVRPDPRAYLLFLEARGVLRVEGATGVSRADSLLTQAVAIDPGFDGARKLLAWVRERR